MSLNIAPLILISLFAGFVKGVVGFAMPLIMFSGFLAFLPQEKAIALIILPAFISNIFQAYGLSVLETRKFFFNYLVLIIVLFSMVFIVSQFFLIVTENFIHLTLAILIFAFLYFQLAGIRFHILKRSKVFQVIFGIISGFFGGISGQWGPPLVIYFLSQNLSVKQIICYQGLTYSIASLALIGGHINSGVLSIELALLSIPFILISSLGQYAGTVFRELQSTNKFRKFTLLTLFLFGVFFIFRVISNSSLF